jgi:hypothetical protein
MCLGNGKVYIYIYKKESFEIQVELLSCHFPVGTQDYNAEHLDIHNPGGLSNLSSSECKSEERLVLR